jgi:hypothetical protein
LLIASNLLEVSILISIEVRGRSDHRNGNLAILGTSFATFEHQGYPGSLVGMQSCIDSFALRDGFEAVEQSSHEDAITDAEFAAGDTVTHADVLRGGLGHVRAIEHPSSDSTTLGLKLVGKS